MTHHVIISNALAQCDLIALARCEWSNHGVNGATAPVPSVKNVKNSPPKQDVALFLHSSTITVAPLK